jgi:rare lipoprotein A
VTRTANRIVGAQREGRGTLLLLELARRLRHLQVPCALCALCICFWSCASRRTDADRPEPPQVGAVDTGENAGAPSRPDRASDPRAKAPRSVSSGAAKHGGATATPNPVLSAYTEEGIASWYGIPFHGRRASNGEVYDMNKLTAAHRTLPFETVVRVTNLSNGKATVVRITDRGPFVDNRIIDLSMAAAREIDSVGAGVVPVRLEIVSAGIDPGSGFFTVQVGAFRERGNAERLRERLTPSYSPIFIQPYDSPDGLFYRVRVGKVPGEVAAQQFGEKLRNREGFKPTVVRLDEGANLGETK